jgi:glycogen(starch) synthase
MKILMLGWELPPHNSGGLGIACYQLCRALSKKNIAIDFVVPYQADHGIDFMTVTAAKPQGVATVIRSGIAYDSYKYIKEDGSEEWLNIYDQQELYEHAVAKLVEEKEFDLLHAHDWLTFRAALRAKEISGKPLIAHVHSIESDRSGKEGGGNPLVRDIEGTALMIADRVIAVSEHTKQAINREYGVPLDKIEVVHNNFDRELMIPEEGPNAYAYLDLMKRNGYRVVCNIGRITIQKGLTNLVQAFRHVVKYSPKTILLIAGAGEQYLELVELAAALGIAFPTGQGLP